MSDDEEIPACYTCRHAWVSSINECQCRCRVWWCRKCGLSGGTGEHAPDLEEGC